MRPPVELSEQEIKLLLTALAMAASRRESQARAHWPSGVHHEKEATAMRSLRFKLRAHILPPHTSMETDK